MLFHRPLAKLRDLNRRFGQVEAVVHATAEADRGRHDLLTHLRAEVSALTDTVSDLRGQVEEGRRAAASALQAARRSHAAAELAARRLTARSTTTRVVVVAHHIEAWDGCADLVAALDEAPDFDVAVVSVPRHFGGLGDPRDEDLVHEGLAARGVRHLRFGHLADEEASAALRALDPDVVIRQSQWDADVPAPYRTDALAFTRLAVVPYETMNLVVNIGREDGGNSAVDSAAHRSAWLVFVANDAMLEYARRDGLFAGAQFRVTGHPKADRLRAAGARWPIPAGGGPAPARVLWSAHHSIGTGWSDFGLFPDVCSAVLEWVRDDRHLQVAFSPHPALVPFIRSEASPVAQSAYDSWSEEWAGEPNAATVHGGAYAEALAAADVVLTDGLSLLVEAQVLGRPVVFLERPGHRPFTSIGERVLRGVHRVRSLAGAQRVIRDIRQHGDPLAPMQEENVRDLFGPPGAAHRIVSTLRRELAADTGPAARTSS